MRKFKLRDTMKQALTQVGAACSFRMLSSADRALNYLWVGRWMREKGFHVPRRTESREDIFASAAKEFRDRDVLYLEFGVYNSVLVSVAPQSTE